MGIIINEQKLIEENAELLSGRMGSQLNRFLDKKPTMVEYFHINNRETTVDNGFQHVGDNVGPASPLRFNRIKNFPLYGIQEILFDLSDEEEGLTINYESDAIILPETVQPYMEDHFVINYLDKMIIFKITEISLDNIKSNNFYKINFCLEYTDIDRYNMLLNQTTDDYDCIFENIGTNDTCIVLSADYDTIQRLDKLHAKVQESYMRYFYDAKFNVFMVNKDRCGYYYDPYLNNFIRLNNIFNVKSTNMTTYYISVQDKDDMFDYEYDYSMYRCLEKKNISKIKYTQYSLKPISQPDSIFKVFHQGNVLSMRFTRSVGNDYINKELIEKLISNPDSLPLDTDNIVYDIIYKFFKNELTLKNIDVERLEDSDLDWVDPNNLEEFIMIPIVLFIIRKVYKEYIEVSVK